MCRLKKSCEVVQNCRAITVRKREIEWGREINGNASVLLNESQWDSHEIECNCISAVLGIRITMKRLP